jgi:aspartyl aminopeptidase
MTLAEAPFGTMADMESDPLAFAADLTTFLDAAPTSYHAAALVAEHLAEAGFEPWRRGSPAPVPTGYTVREGAVAAWRVPPTWQPSDGVRIVASHTDSPALKVKPEPGLGGGAYAQIGVEVYGGPLLGTWLDRELGLAGRIVTPDGTTRLVRTAPLARIPHLAPHLERSLGDSVTLDRQRHIQPVLSLSAACDPRDLIAASAGLGRDDIVGADLFCYPTEPAQVFGPATEFLAAWRLDNLSSVYASLRAFLEPAAAGRSVAVLIAFDHEEVGSATSTGAQGPLLGEVMRAIGRGVGLEPDASDALWADTTCVSADAGQAFHPNYAGHFDPVHQPRLGAGPLLKVNANRRYATDGVGAALWHRACQAAGVPTQMYVNRNTVPGGGTIGSLTAARWGITTVDVGIPLLSMHSARELCGTVDPPWLAQALTAYWAGA